MPTADPDSRALPGGLTLRTARPGDLDQIGALLERRGEPGDALDHRLVVEDPDEGWRSCAVVVAGAGIERDEVLLSTHRRHYRFTAGPDGLEPAVVGGPLQDPVDAGGAGVAPDWLPSLLFGPWGIEGLAGMRPDVTADGDPELFAVLFPPVTADVLSYYLPF